MNKSITQEQTLSALHDRESEAVELLKNEKKTSAVLDKAKKLLAKIKKMPIIGTLIDDITTTIELVGDYVKGNYRTVPIRVIVSALAAIIYLVSPIDLIPDFIPFAGFVDDAAVLTLALGTGLSLELNKYRKWKFSKVRDALIKDVTEIVADVANKKSLVAGFITDDNELKLLLAESTDLVAMPIDVQSLIISLPFSELRTISDALNVTVADILDNALADMLLVDSYGNRHKICRESDFKEFDEIFEIVTEED